jgi:hypothetical protein
MLKLAFQLDANQEIYYIVYVKMLLAPMLICFCDMHLRYQTVDCRYLDNSY